MKSTLRFQSQLRLRRSSKPERDRQTLFKVAFKSSRRIVVPVAGAAMEQGQYFGLVPALSPE